MDDETIRNVPATDERVAATCDGDPITTDSTSSPAATPNPVVVAQGCLRATSTSTNGLLPPTLTSPAE